MKCTVKTWTKHQKSCFVFAFFKTWFKAIKIIYWQEGLNVFFSVLTNNLFFHNSPTIDFQQKTCNSN